MEELKPLRVVSSERRDSSYFMWNSEDVDIDESDEFTYEKNDVYIFKWKESLLVTNKGNTRRVMPTNYKLSNELEKAIPEKSKSEHKDEFSITFDLDHDHSKSWLKEHSKFSKKYHVESSLSKK